MCKGVVLLFELSSGGILDRGKGFLVTVQSRAGKRLIEEGTYDLMAGGTESDRITFSLAIEEAPFPSICAHECLNTPSCFQFTHDIMMGRCLLIPVYSVITMVSSFNLS